VRKIVLVIEGSGEIDTLCRILEANLAKPAEERDPYFEALFGSTSFSRAIEPQVK